MYHYQFDDKLTDTQGYIARDDVKKEIIVACRGSIQLQDFLTGLSSLRSFLLVIDFTIRCRPGFRSGGLLVTRGVWNKRGQGAPGLSSSFQQHLLDRDLYGQGTACRTPNLLTHINGPFPRWRPRFPRRHFACYELPGRSAKDVYLRTAENGELGICVACRETRWCR